MQTGNTLAKLVRLKSSPPLIFYGRRNFNKTVVVELRSKKILAVSCRQVFLIQKMTNARRNYITCNVRGRRFESDLPDFFDGK